VITAVLRVATFGLGGRKQPQIEADIAPSSA
jgi:hypothetical protein